MRTLVEALRKAVLSRYATTKTKVLVRWFSRLQFYEVTRQETPPGQLDIAMWDRFHCREQAGNSSTSLRPPAPVGLLWLHSRGELDIASFEWGIAQEKR